MKALSICLLITCSVLVIGCVNKQKISEQERIDKELGGISRVGLVDDPSQIQEIADYAFGAEQVGIRFLDEKTSLNAWRNIRLAERALLYAGDTEQALKYLGRALFKEPRSRDAHALVRQLEITPENFFGSQQISLIPERVVVHKVKQNEKIKHIARKYYGDENYYIGLLRYNGLMREVAEGEEIRIPGGKRRKSSRRSSLAQFAADKPKADTVANKTETVQKTVSASGDGSAADIQPGLEVSNEAVKNSDDSKDLPVMTDGQDETVDIASAGQEITIEPAIPPESVNISQPEADGITQSTHQLHLDDNDMQLSPVSESKAMSDAEEEAFALYDEGAFSNAFLAFKEVQEPSGKALRMMDELKDRLIEVPYAKGLTLYQQQKLDLAIEAFDKVLSTDPQHTQALLYKNRCQQLLEQLNKL